VQATVGDWLLVHGRIVGQHDRAAEVIEVLGENGEPPYRVRFEDGHEAIMTPGPDTVVRPASHGNPLSG
jgi:tartrate dehydratase beta subunit/fumarate hydratase class I family protein